MEGLVMKLVKSTKIICLAFSLLFGSLAATDANAYVVVGVGPGWGGGYYHPYWGGYGYGYRPYYGYGYRPYYRPYWGGGYYRPYYGYGGYYRRPWRRYY
jgi:hypothetical protein